MITRPDDQIAAAARAPGLRIAEVMATVFQGYADRPALGSGSAEIVTDRHGPISTGFLPRFETISYADYGRAFKRWPPIGISRVRIRCVPGTSYVYWDSPASTTQPSNAPAFTSVRSWCPCRPAHRPASTRRSSPRPSPEIFAVGIDNSRLRGSSLAASLTGAAPQRLIVFDYEPRDDDQRDIYQAARTRLAAAGSALAIETIDDWSHGPNRCPPPPLHVASGDEDPLAWVFYTSGSTGTPKGAMFTESLCIGTWLAQSDQPVITLSYMPMSHLIGYGYVILTLANGGTSYFAAKSDLSTLFDDLALARPTTLSLVPRVCEMFYPPLLSGAGPATPGGADPSRPTKCCSRDPRTDAGRAACWRWAADRPPCPGDQGRSWSPCSTNIC